MNELNEKLAEWAGFTQDKYGNWINPDGTHYVEDEFACWLHPPDFPNDLKACFEHLEPELYRRGFRYQLTRLQDGHMAFIFAPGKGWANIVADAFAEKPATAFCKAVEQLIKEGTDG